MNSPHSCFTNYLLAQWFYEMLLISGLCQVSKGDLTCSELCSHFGMSRLLQTWVSWRHWPPKVLGSKNLDRVSKLGFTHSSEFEILSCCREDQLKPFLVPGSRWQALFHFQANFTRFEIYSINVSLSAGQIIRQRYVTYHWVTSRRFRKPRFIPKCKIFETPQITSFRL